MQNQFTKLIADFSTNLGFDQIALNEEQECIMAIDEHLVTIASQGEYLMVYASFWTVPEKNKEQIYYRLLTGNFFYSETRGATLGLNSFTNDVQLIYRDKLDGIDSNALNIIVENFMCTLEYWLKKCQQLVVGLENVQSNSEESLDYSEGQSFIKV